MQLHLVDLASATLADGSSIALAPRDAALLAWLALEGPTPRARLAALLWPTSEPEAARNTLRQRLFHLKKHALKKQNVPQCETVTDKAFLRERLARTAGLGS